MMPLDLDDGGLGYVDRALLPVTGRALEPEPQAVFTDGTGQPKAPEVVRVESHIVYVETVRLGACVCGSIKESCDPAMVKLARRYGDLPAILCGCGRVIVGRKQMVIA